MQVKDAKPGELIKLLIGSAERPSVAVYVRGPFDRTSKRYSITRWDDANAERFVKGHMPCTADFEL